MKYGTTSLMYILRQDDNIVIGTRLTSYILSEYVGKYLKIISQRKLGCNEELANESIGDGILGDAYRPGTLLIPPFIENKELELNIADWDLPILYADEGTKYERMFSDVLRITTFQHKDIVREVIGRRKR